MVQDARQEPDFFVNRSEVIWAIGMALLNMSGDCAIIAGHKMLDLADVKHRVLEEVYKVPKYEMEVYSE